MPKKQSFILLNKGKRFATLTEDFSVTPYRVHIELDPDVDLTDLPMSFDIYVRLTGSKNISDKWAMEWLTDRVIPETQAGAMEKLARFGIYYHDVLTLFHLADGRCKLDFVSCTDMNGNLLGGNHIRELKWRPL